MDKTNVDLLKAIRSTALSSEFQLVWEFFILFSVFEYALKRDSRYIKAGQERAEANWDIYASRNNDSFKHNQSEPLKSAIEYFRETPPRKQLNKELKITWSEPEYYSIREPILKWLLRVIRLVRNNLFHGGKYPEINIPEPSRDRELLRHSITILTAALKLDAKVQSNFNEGLDGLNSH